MDKAEKYLKELLRANIHDLKNFLSPIILYSEFIRDAVSDNETKENCDIILEKSEFISQHLEAMRLLYSDSSWYEQNSWRELLRRLYFVFSPLFRSKSKVLLFRYVDNEKFSLKRDDKKHREILSNLVELSNKNDSNCLLVLVDKKDDKGFSFYFFEENIDSASKVEPIKSVSKEEIREKIKSQKAISLVEWEEEV
ncbi:MAG: hypothetical protein ACE14Q_06895 [Acidobacteriota bacterium]|nr:hypothetical protein [Thermoanaerobaculaceae bacterium]